jgi:hypothetical protein
MEGCLKSRRNKTKIKQYVRNIQQEISGYNWSGYLAILWLDKS